MNNLVSLTKERFNPEDFSVEDFVELCKEKSADKIRIGVYPEDYEGNIFYQNENIRIAAVHFSITYSGVKNEDILLVRKPELLEFSVFHEINKQGYLIPLKKQGSFDDNSRWTGLFEEIVDRALVCASYDQNISTKLLIYSIKRSCIANLNVKPEDNDKIDDFTNIVDSLNRKIIFS